MVAVSTPMRPVSWPRRFCNHPDAIESRVLTMLDLLYLPRVNSAISAGYAKRKAKKRYISRNAPPPFSAAFVGKPQILPRPTADPEAARTNVKRDENWPRCIKAT